ncbi:MFS transporter [Streptomyces caniferus]|uniref:MFS transporter n=1 Tax=Streptomyces caniferus TaxID=285557 RepID=UPI003722F554
MGDDDFRKYFWAEASSRFGTVLTLTATSTIAVEHLHATDAQIGMLSAAGYLPAAVLGPLVGRAADRARRPRRFLRRCDLLAGACLALTCLVTVLGTLSMRWLTCLAVLLGCVSVAAETLYFVHLQVLVPAERLTRARARLQGGEYAAALAGNGLAGIVVVAFGGALAFGIDAVTYGLSAVLLSRIRRADRPVQECARHTGRAEQPRQRPFVPGSFLRRLLPLLMLQAIASAAGTALLAPFLLRDLDVPVGLYGVAFLATGAAGMAGSWAAPRVTARGTPRQWFLAAAGVQVLAAAGLAGAGGAFPLALAVAGGCLAMSKAAGAVANVTLSTLIVADSAPESLGRVVALLRSAVTACQVGGALAAGLLAGAVGTRTALWCAALLPVLATPWLAAGLRRDRHGPRPRTAPDHAPRRTTS